jgi:type II secretory pathway pseudopilin PulG
MNSVTNTRISAIRPRGLGDAFSLIEFVGVLAILAIIAAAAVPAVIKRIDIAAYNAESVSLKAMSEALIQHIVRSNNIPNHDTWVQAISAELPLAQTNIAATSRRWNRVFVVDPGIWCASTLGSSSWNQAVGGISVAPTNARIMILSTLARELPVSSGMPANFQNIWDTPTRAKPSTWTTWSGRGEDVLIQRINLEPLFHRVLLLNGYIGGQGYYSINGSSPGPVPYGGAGTNSYYLDGTILGLHYTNSSGMNLMAKEVIKTDLSRVFEYGLWRDQISGGMNPGVLSGLDSVAASFFNQNAPDPPPDWGGNPKVLLGLMNAYMNGYATWAAMSPCFGYFRRGNPNAANFPGCDEIRYAIDAFSKGGDVVP